MPIPCGRGLLAGKDTPAARVEYEQGTGGLDEHAISGPIEDGFAGRRPRAYGAKDTTGRCVKDSYSLTVLVTHQDMMRPLIDDSISDDNTIGHYPPRWADVHRP